MTTPEKVSPLTTSKITQKRALTVLFIPVSSAKGIGEYIRSLTLAEALQKQNQHCNIHFILSAEAPYLHSCPFPSHVTTFSPTRCTQEVNTYISAINPDIVIFDASGRVAQLKHCHTLGIATVFICQNAKKLYKGLRWRRLLYTNQIWYVQPLTMLPKLSCWARKKIAIKQKILQKNIGLKKATTLFLDPLGPIFTPTNQELWQTLKCIYTIEEKHFLIVNAGSGGHYHNNQKVIDLFVSAVSAFMTSHVRENSKTKHRLKVLVIYGPNYNSPLPSQVHPDIILIPSVTPNAFTTLLHHASGALLTGGSALFQAVQYNVPTLAVSVASDQSERIHACINNSKHNDHSLQKLTCHSASITDALSQMYQNTSKNINGKTLSDDFDKTDQNNLHAIDQVINHIHTLAYMNKGNNTP